MVSMNGTIRQLILWLCLAGLFAFSATAQEMQSLGAIGVADASGIRIVGLVPGGAAKKAGLAIGDVLTALDGKPPRKITEKTELMTAKRAGSKLVVMYLRRGRTATATLVVGPPVQRITPTASAIPQDANAQNNHVIKKISTEFAKAANLALIAIKNRTEWNLQQQAINSAEAEAVSPEETAAIESIKSLAGKRAMQQQIWENYYNLALAQFMSRNPRATSAEVTAGINADPRVSAAQNDLDKNDACNAAWRLSLRDGDGTEPAECKTSK